MQNKIQERLDQLTQLGCTITEVPGVDKDIRRPEFLEVEFKSEQFHAIFKVHLNVDRENSISSKMFIPYCLGMIAKQPENIETNWVSAAANIRYITDRYAEFLSEENPLMILNGVWPNRYFIFSKNTGDILLKYVTRLVLSFKEYEETHPVGWCPENNTENHNS